MFFFSRKKLENRIDSIITERFDAFESNIESIIESQFDGVSYSLCNHVSDAAADAVREAEVEVDTESLSSEISGEIDTHHENIEIYIDNRIKESENVLMTFIKDMVVSKLVFKKDKE